MADDEDAGPKPNKANVDDEFLRHPHSGALFRNPLHPSLEKSRSTPILFQASEYHHNCLDDALNDWHCITITEDSFRNLTAGVQGETAGTSSTLKTTAASSLVASSTRLNTRLKASVNKLGELPSGYEFVVTVRKLSYIPPRNRRRNQEPKSSAGVTIDKVNMEVVPLGASLRIENITEGLIAVWNRSKPFFMVKPGDHITGVNGKRDPIAMLEEMNTAPDSLRIMVRRFPSERGPEETLLAPAG